MRKNLNNYNKKVYRQLPVKRFLNGCQNFLVICGGLRLNRKKGNFILVAALSFLKVCSCLPQAFGLEL